QVDVRILAATNQDLKAKIAEGSFREDLYFRLARFTVTIPPLREHKEDIPLLAEHFLRMFASEMGIKEPAITPEALSLLERYSFPGNVRELKNIIEHALIKSDDGVIRPEHLHFITDSGIPSYPPMTLTGQISGISADFEYLRDLVVKRAQKRASGDGGMSDEERILEYVEKHGSISNSECQRLLSVDLRRASYLLNKLHEYGLLKREGERRWARYRLP
ncbi:TPA: sigma-54-dependent Fis family transcriptional regulator, partial [Candidatus Poribacteria bacterium]|nr:sigma-54-dependent Fis family transcriptional regulator [Candidatus Poribacteria bacterium]HEX30352.1 sigma-54-dependent Fis family transcriptional regulator [Candidatus Poribacteria bacterium]